MNKLKKPKAPLGFAKGGSAFLGGRQFAMQQDQGTFTAPDENGVWRRYQKPSADGVLPMQESGYVPPAEGYAAAMNRYGSGPAQRMLWDRNKSVAELSREPQSNYERGGPNYFSQTFGTEPVRGLSPGTRGFAHGGSVNGPRYDLTSHKDRMEVHDPDLAKEKLLVNPRLGFAQGGQATSNPYYENLYRLEKEQQINNNAQNQKLAWQRWQQESELARQNAKRDALNQERQYGLSTRQADLNNERFSLDQIKNQQDYDLERMQADLANRTHTDDYDYKNANLNQSGELERAKLAQSERDTLNQYNLSQVKLAQDNARYKEKLAFEKEQYAAMLPLEIAKAQQEIYLAKQQGTQGNMENAYKQKMDELNYLRARRDYETSSPYNKIDAQNPIFEKDYSRFAGNRSNKRAVSEPVPHSNQTAYYMGNRVIIPSNPTAGVQGFADGGMAYNQPSYNPYLDATGNMLAQTAYDDRYNQNYTNAMQQQQFMNELARQSAEGNSYFEKQASDLAKLKQQQDYEFQKASLAQKALDAANQYKLDTGKADLENKRFAMDSDKFKFKSDWLGKFSKDFTGYASGGMVDPTTDQDFWRLSANKQMSAINNYNNYLSSNGQGNSIINPASNQAFNYLSAKNQVANVNNYNNALAQSGRVNDFVNPTSLQSYNFLSADQRSNAIGSYNNAYDTYNQVAKKSTANQTSMPSSAPLGATQPSLSASNYFSSNTTAQPSLSDSNYLSSNKTIATNPLTQNSVLATNNALASNTTNTTNAANSALDKKKYDFKTNWLDSLGNMAGFNKPSSTSMPTSDFNTQKFNYKTDWLNSFKSGYGFSKGGSLKKKPQDEHPIGKTDIIPAMLTPNEFVLSVPAVAKLGADNLDQFNKEALAESKGKKVKPSKAGAKVQQAVNNLKTNEDIQGYAGGGLSSKGIRFGGDVANAPTEEDFYKLKERYERVAMQDALNRRAAENKASRVEYADGPQSVYSQYSDEVGTPYDATRAFGMPIIKKMEAHNKGQPVSFETETSGTIGVHGQGEDAVRAKMKDFTKNLVQRNAYNYQNASSYTFDPTMGVYLPEFGFTSAGSGIPNLPSEADRAAELMRKEYKDAYYANEQEQKKQDLVKAKNDQARDAAAWRRLNYDPTKAKPNNTYQKTVNGTPIEYLLTEAEDAARYKKLRPEYSSLAGYSQGGKAKKPLGFMLGGFGTDDYVDELLLDEYGNPIDSARRVMMQDGVRVKTQEPNFFAGVQNGKELAPYKPAKQSDYIGRNGELTGNALKDDLRNQFVNQANIRKRDAIKSAFYAEPTNQELPLNAKQEQMLNQSMARRNMNDSLMGKAKLGANVVDVGAVANTAHGLASMAKDPAMRDKLLNMFPEYNTDWGIFTEPKDYIVNKAKALMGDNEDQGGDAVRNYQTGAANPRNYQTGKGSPQDKPFILPEGIKEPSRPKKYDAVVKTANPPIASKPRAKSSLGPSDYLPTPKDIYQDENGKYVVEYNGKNNRAAFNDLETAKRMQDAFLVSGKSLNDYHDINQPFVQAENGRRAVALGDQGVFASGGDLPSEGGFDGTRDMIGMVDQARSKAAKLGLQPNLGAMQSLLQNDRDQKFLDSLSGMNSDQLFDALYGKSARDMIAQPDPLASEGMQDYQKDRSARAATLNKLYVDQQNNLVSQADAARARSDKMNEPMIPISVMRNSPFMNITDQGELSRAWAANKKHILQPYLNDLARAENDEQRKAIIFNFAKNNHLQFDTAGLYANGGLLQKLDPYATETTGQ